MTQKVSSENKWNFCLGYVESDFWDTMFKDDKALGEAMKPASGLQVTCIKLYQYKLNDLKRDMTHLPLNCLSDHWSAEVFNSNDFPNHGSGPDVHKLVFRDTTIENDKFSKKR